MQIRFTTPRHLFKHDGGDPRARTRGRAKDLIFNVLSESTGILTVIWGQRGGTRRKKTVRSGFKLGLFNVSFYWEPAVFTAGTSFE